MNLMHHTAILWRGPGSVQIGGDRARHVRLDDLHAGDQLWLASQARPVHAPDGPEASPDLLAALTQADLVDHPDRRPLLSVGVLGAAPATLLALRSLVDTLALRLRIDAPALVDGDWDHVFGGVYTGTPRSRAVRRELASLIPLPHLHAQDAPDVALVSADRAQDPGIPFELMAADTPHLLITRGEHSYEIGPFVLPGSTPCFHCIEHERAEQDPYHLVNSLSGRWDHSPSSHTSPLPCGLRASCATSLQEHSPRACAPRSPRSTRTEASPSNARSGPANACAAFTVWRASSGPVVDDDFFAAHQRKHRGCEALNLDITDAANHPQLRRVLRHGLSNIAQRLIGEHRERRHARLT